MGSSIAVVTDMIFAARIRGTAEKIGTECQVVSTMDALRSALEGGQPGVVLVDMSADGLSPSDAIRAVKELHPAARVVAFFSHTQTELLEQARAAGADDILPRSAFVQRLPDLLR